MRRTFAIHSCVGVVLVFMGLSQGYATTQAKEEGPTVSTIFSSLRDQLIRVHSIRYKAVTRAESPSRSKPAGMMTLENRTETVISGDKYLVKTQTLNSELSGSKDSTQAFDGVEYQLMDEESGRLSTNTIVSSNQPMMPYRVPQPITMMFTFALDLGLRKDYLSLKQSDLWSRIAMNSKVSGHELVGSIPCTVVRVSSLDKGNSATLFLAERLGYYPFKVVYETGILTRTDLVEAFESVANQGGELVVPTKVTTNGILKKSGRNMASVMTVDPGSLEVNGRVRDTIFTLPKNQAPVRIDVAKGEAYKDGATITQRDHNVSIPDPTRSNLNLILVALSVGLITIGVVVTVLRKFLRSRSSS